MRILLTNDDGIHAEGLAGPRAHRPHAFATMSGSSRRRPTSRASRIRCRCRSRCACARSATSTSPCAARRPTASSWACADLLPRAAGPRPVRHQFRLQHRRRRHLFRHGRRRHRGHAARHPLDRAQPGLSASTTASASCPGRRAKRWRRSSWRSCSRSTCRRRLPQPQLPELRARRGRGRRASPRRASSPTASTSRSAPTVAASPITGCASAATRRNCATAPTSMRVRSNFVSVTPLKLDLTAHELRDQLSKALA